LSYWLLYKNRILVVDMCVMILIVDTSVLDGICSIFATPCTGIWKCTYTFFRNRVFMLAGIIQRVFY